MMKYLPQDKATHYFYNQLVAIAAYLVLLVFGTPNPIVVAIAFGLAVGVSVELYQKKTGTGFPDVMDFLWGGLGVVLAFVPIAAQRFLV